ncbi:hypothetical protein DFH09DRAFT_1075436 [Mycena vulgaris]|nr:hypothetical protein DFH09DRAFT_1075436 [Mycena vulgaris]
MAGWPRQNKGVAQAPLGKPKGKEKEKGRCTHGLRAMGLTLGLRHHWLVSERKEYGDEEGRDDFDLAEDSEWDLMISRDNDLRWRRLIFFGMGEPEVRRRLASNSGSEGCPEARSVVFSCLVDLLMPAMDVERTRMKERAEARKTQ